MATPEVQKNEDVHKKTTELSDDPETLKKGLEETLLQLEFNGETLQQKLNILEDKLPLIDKTLKLLEAKYPDDPDLKLYRAYFEDLSRDLREKRKPHLDESFRLLVQDMKDEIDLVGIKTGEEANESMKPVLDQLREAGINASYSVYSGNPNAKTVVLFTQAHPNIGVPTKFYDAMQVTASQKFIYDATESAVAKGLTSTLYSEGIGADETLTQKEVSQATSEEFEPALRLAPFMLKKDLGDKIEVSGFEDVPFLQKAAKSIYLDGDSDMGHRIGLNNILIAENVALKLSTSSEKMAFLAIGGKHEDVNLGADADNSQDVDQRDKIVLSQVLAYYGMNVVVVNTYNKDQMLDGMQKFSQWSKTPNNEDKIMAIAATLPKSKREEFIKKHAVSSKSKGVKIGKFQISK